MPTIIITRLSRKRRDIYTHAVQLPGFLRPVLVCSIQDARTLAGSYVPPAGETVAITEPPASRRLGLRLTR